MPHSSTHLPTQFSSTELFPALWPPTTAICGRSIGQVMPRALKASWSWLTMGINSSIPGLNAIFPPCSPATCSHQTVEQKDPISRCWSPHSDTCIHTLYDLYTWPLNLAIPVWQALVYSQNKVFHFRFLCIPSIPVVPVYLVSTNYITYIVNWLIIITLGALLQTYLRVLFFVIIKSILDMSPKISTREIDWFCQYWCAEISE